MHHLLKILVYTIILSLHLPGYLFAAQEFVIEDIRVEGLQRLTPGTVFNYLPMKVGDTFDDERSAEAVRALFKTGLFEDVRLERDGGVLVFIIKERPAIGSITLNGNKDIRTEDLLDGLKQIGFAEGRVFNQSQLDKLEQELRRQYFSLGKYAVGIESTVTPLENNRVAVTIDISEGIAAKIRQINIVGNDAFSEKKLLKVFKLTTPTMISFFTKSDQYSREKLSADLESLRTYYLDRGYINFNVDSTQVSITPDKKDIYITINISEGEPYTISGVKLAGDLVLPEADLIELIDVKKGELFSLGTLTKSTKAITDSLGNEGYAFANVNSVPDIDKENKTVAVTFFVDPGKRAYVRRINFSGNTRTRDEVLRREMRQPEGGWISTEKVERGKVRLQKLGYFQEVNVETPAVQGTTDQVDVNYTVVEQQSGQLGAGIGFSQSAGIIFQTSVTQENFLGSGKRVSFAFSNSDVNRRFGLGYTNPYYTIDGISRGFDAFYRETEGLDANVTAFDSRVYGGGVNLGIPVTEFNSFRTALNYENTSINNDGDFADEVQEFIAANGDQFDIFKLLGNYAYDSRNKAVLPDAGTYHNINAEIALPFIGNSLEFYKVQYRTQWFTNFLEDYIISLRGQVGYGAGYSDTEELPFFENFYTGGPDSIRGYEENTVGPKDSDGRPLGGNFELTGGAEVILPVPFFRDIKSTRITGFFDAGNVYGEDESVDFGLLRYSVGISGMWVSPFGIIRMSFAQPFGDEPDDQLQAFQFTFGSAF
ncbi:MAG: outer membrane protein assembly factor BamA [Gammaproteobacteria bacterium]|nr:outer membrane protein assembly factor BamA [Gammaproteobacteria bacterium]